MAEARADSEIAPGVPHRRLARRLALSSAAVLAVLAVLATVAALVSGALIFRARADYRPLATGYFYAPGPGRPTPAKDLIPSLGTLPGGRTPSRYRYTYQSATFTVVGSLRNVGGRAVTIEGWTWHRRRHFFPRRSAETVKWNADLGGSGPRHLFPTPLGGGRYLTLYIALPWPSCNVRGYVAGSSLQLQDAIVHYRFWGENHTQSVPLGFIMQFPGGDQCGHGPT